MTLTHQLPIPSKATLEEQQVRWRMTVRERLTHMELRPLGRENHFGSVTQRDLGDVLITDWITSDVEGIRGSTMARQEAEALLLFTASSGRQIIETPHQTVVLRPGTVLIMSTRATGRFVIPENLTKRTVRIPLTALAPFDTGARLPECLSLDAAANPLAALTHDYLSAVGREVESMTAAEVEGARNALLVLIAGMLRWDPLESTCRHASLSIL